MTVINAKKIKDNCNVLNNNNFATKIFHLSLVLNINKV